MPPLEIPYFIDDIMELLRVKNSETIRKAIKQGRFPPPDVQISRKTRYWHKSTLIKAGILKLDNEK